VSAVSAKYRDVVSPARTVCCVSFELRGAAGRKETVLTMPAEVVKRTAAGDGCCCGVGSKNIF